MPRHRDEVEFEVALPVDLYRQLDARAKAKHHSLNEELVYLVTRYVMQDARELEAERKVREWIEEGESGHQ